MAKKLKLSGLEKDPLLQPMVVKSRFKKLLETRRLWEPIWQELADYIMPETNDVIIRKAPGIRRTEKLFDSTPIFASELLAASIHGTLTSSYIKWFALQLPDPDLNDDEEVATYLDKCANIMFLAFNESNFASEANEMYNRLVPFGTGTIEFEEKPDRDGSFLFKTIRIQDMAIAEGEDGRVDSVFTSLPMTRRQIMQRWPDAEKDVPEFAMPKGMADPNPEEPFEIIHAVVPVSRETNSKFKWGSTFILSKHDKPLSVKGYYEFPYMCVRWSKETGETYGRGRGHTALPDIKTLNKMVELELRALGKVVNPPVKAKGGDVIGQVKLSSGGVTTVRDMESIAPLLPPMDFNPVNLKVQELKTSVKQMFYADQLQMPNSNPQMTATEANIRYELMQRVLGPTLGRIESEFLDPLVARAFKILQRAGKLPPPPEKLLQNKKAMLNVRYEGPLARAQKASDVSAVQQLEQIIEPIAQTHPEVMDNIDLDGLTRHTAAVLGIPSRFIKGQDAVDQMRQDRQQQAQQQQEQQATLTAATAAGKAAPMVKALHGAPEQGSVVQQMTQGANGNGGQPTQ